jgi:hypothetical protein
MSLLRPREDTRPWKGAYAPYDLVKELCIAVGVVALLTVLLAVLFSSPDERSSTIAQWSRQMPINFVATAAKELDGTSTSAGYGPPYNHNGEGQHAWFLHLQKWLGVSHPLDNVNDFVIAPLRTVPNNPALQGAVAEYAAAPEKTRLGWAEAFDKPLNEYKEAEEESKPLPKSVSLNASTGAVAVQASGTGPVPTLMAGLLALAQSGGLEGALTRSNQFFQTDYTKPLLLMADGKLLEERAEHQNLLGGQWGMMNETGAYPGQAWLWLYAFWYQIEPFKSSENADILVMLVMTVLSLAFICIPFLPVVNRIPRWIPVYKLIWREHYRRS